MPRIKPPNTFARSAPCTPAGRCAARPFLARGTAGAALRPSRARAARAQGRDLGGDILAYAANVLDAAERPPAPWWPLKGALEELGEAVKQARARPARRPAARLREQAARPPSAGADARAGRRG